MSNQIDIDYLNSVKAANSGKISDNLASIDAYNSAISSLNSQIISYQQLQSDLTATNTQLAADNVIIDHIISIL